MEMMMVTAIVILTLGCKKRLEDCCVMETDYQLQQKLPPAHHHYIHHLPCLFFIDIITIAIIIITTTNLQCNRLPDHSVLKNNRRLNSRELPFLTCTPAHTEALYICW